VIGVEAGETGTVAGEIGPEVRPVTGAGARVLAVATLLTATSAATPAGPDVEIRVSVRGFEPAEITVRKGESTRVVVTSADREHCFAVDALRVEKRVVAGRPTAFHLVPARTGRFEFYCCLETGEAAERERGVIVVIE
jgi:heme/copper-type cytochrome/quinol oxidase subunit 2